MNFFFPDSTLPDTTYNTCGQNTGDIRFEFKIEQNYPGEI